MTAYRVDLDALTDFIARVRRFDAELLGAVDDAGSSVRGLHDVWDGEAAATHDQAHAQWQHAAAGMRDGLARMRKAASAAHTNYHGAGEANRRMWAAIS